MNGVQREFMPFLSPWVQPVMYVMAFIAIGVMFRGFYLKKSYYGIEAGKFGKELFETVKTHFNQVTSNLLRYILGHQKVIRFKYPGVMHLFIFFGMLVLFLGTFLIFIDHDFLRFLGIASIMSGSFYLVWEWLLDLFGLLLIVGLLLAIFRRLFFRPFYVQNQLQNFVILVGLLYVAVSGFIIEASRLTLEPVAWAPYSFIGYGISKLLAGLSLNETFLTTSYQFLWWSHLLIALSLIAAIPFTVLKHLVLIPFNLPFLSDLRPKAKLTTPFNILEWAETDYEEDVTIGLSQEGDFNWRQKLHIASCVNCGRCESVCPSYASGRELSPRALMQNISLQFDKPMQRQDCEDFFKKGVVSEEQVWGCTNCGACVEECPAMLNHIDYLIDFRRFLLSINLCDEQKTNILSRLDQNFNPYGIPSYKRSDWLHELEIPTLEENPDAEVLYWVGCAGSYDTRVRSVVTSLIGIMRRTGIDFAILGYEEKCCGEVAKRMGEEGRFQLIANENVQLLNGYGVKTIVTHCPHCYNTLKYEYTEFGGKFEVLHHTELINKLIEDQRLRLGSKLKQKITYHDPCNLSRLNGIISEPRKILSQVISTPLIETRLSQDRTFCCGAGGGNFWYNVPEQERISQIRLKQLNVNEPETLAVACPFCMVMFEDNIRTMGNDHLKVKDIAEIVFENAFQMGSDNSLYALKEGAAAQIE